MSLYVNDFLILGKNFNRIRELIKKITEHFKLENKNLIN